MPKIVGNNSGRTSGVARQSVAIAPDNCATLSPSLAVGHDCCRQSLGAERSAFAGACAKLVGTGHGAQCIANFSVDHQICQSIQIRCFTIDDHQLRAVALGEDRKPSRRINHQ